MKIFAKGAARVLTALVLGLAGGQSAHAKGLSVQSGDQAVAITVPGASINGVLKASGDILTLPISGIEPGMALLPADETVRRVSVIPGQPATLRIQLDHGRSTTRRIAAGTVVQDKKGDLVVQVPRKHAAGEAAQALARLQPAAPAKPAAIAPVKPVPPAIPKPAAAAKAVTVPVAPKVPTQDSKDALVPAEAKSAKADQEKAAAMIAGLNKTRKADKVATGPKKSESLALAKEPESNALGTTLLLFFVVGAGLFAWVMKRKSPGLVNKSGLNVLASTNLGGKNRLVLVAAGDRELLLAVSEKGTRLIESWGHEQPLRMDDDISGVKLDDDFTLPSAPIAEESPRGEARNKETFSTPGLYHRNVGRPVATSKSPTVAGLLKLRNQNKGVDQEVASGNQREDEVWAREMVRALSRRGANA